MNITYISLLLIACITGMNAMSPITMIETTRNDLRNCQKNSQKRIWPINCDKQQQAYDAAKQEVVKPLRDISEKGPTAAKELNHTISIKPQVKTELKNKILDSYAASAIIEGLIVRNYDKYEYAEYDGKSFEEYCNNVLDQGLIKHPHSTWATDMMGNYIDATNAEFKETKERMMNTIKNMSQ